MLFTCHHIEGANIINLWMSAGRKISVEDAADREAVLAIGYDVNAES